MLSVQRSFMRVLRVAACLAILISVSLAHPAVSYADDEVDPPSGQTARPVPRDGDGNVAEPTSPSSSVVPNVVQTNPPTGCNIPAGGIYGCWWKDSYFRGSNFSIPATKYAQRTVCGFWDLSKSPSDWQNKISSMANWTNDSHYYFTGKKWEWKSFDRFQNSSRATLSSTFNDKINNVSLICYAA